MSDARTVLIVEDDVAFADFLRAAVESVGHRAVVVTTAAGAVAGFTQHRADFALIDILLPQGDGFEVCKAIRKTERGDQVPIVLMTGIYKKASYERQGLQECKANEYIHKPFGVQALWRLLEKHLGAVTGDAEPERPAESHDLSERALVEILAEHVENNSNGVLFVRSRGTTYAIYLQYGDPVFVRSNDPADRLHEVLRRSGQVTAEDVDGALQALADSRGRLRLGQALVRRGALSEDQFQIALQLQLRLIFQHAFQLTEGTCSFIAGSHPTEEDVLLAIRPKALLLIGAKATGARRAIEERLPAGEAQLSRSGEFETRLDELELRGSERALALLVDGTLNVGRFRAIAESAGYDGTALLHGFLLTGLLNVGEAPTPEDEAEAVVEWEPARFSQLPVAAAIADLHRIGASGTLEVRAAAQGPAKRLVFRRGELKVVQSDVEEDRLSDMLVRLRLLSESELDAVLRTFGGIEPDDRALARAIVGSGQVTPLQVYWAAVYQAQSAVHGLFGVIGAKLAWTGGEEPTGVVALPDMPTSEIVLGAVRSLAGATLLALMPPKTAWFCASEGARARAKSMPLNTEEQALLERLREKVQLKELLAAEPQGKIELRRRIFALYSSRLIQESAAPASMTEEPLEESGEGLEVEGGGFLEMLHEDGFATGRTGQHPAIAERAPELVAAAPDADGADPGLLPVFEFGENEPEWKHLGDEPQGDPNRELLARLAAGRAALEAGAGEVELHRDALIDVLDQCETLLRRLIANEAEESTPREAVPSGRGRT